MKLNKIDHAANFKENKGDSKSDLIDPLLLAVVEVWVV